MAQNGSSPAPWAAGQPEGKGQQQYGRRKKQVPAQPPAEAGDRRHAGQRRATSIRAAGPGERAAPASRRQATSRATSASKPSSPAADHRRSCAGGWGSVGANWGWVDMAVILTR